MRLEPPELAVLKRALGRQLAAARQAAEIGQQQIAHQTGYSRSSVAHAEAGRQLLTRDFWTTADGLVQADGALIAGFERIQAAWQDHERRSREAELAEARATAEALGATTLPQPPPKNHAVLVSASPEHIIAYLQEQWHLLVRADNLFGPGRVLRLVHEHIELIESLVRDARGDVRTSLLSLGADYAESAAWLHEDADDQMAHFWAGRALEWAHAAGDHRLIAWALFRRSQQVANERDAAQAIGLARAAQDTGSRLPDQMRAAITQQEAYGLALDGDEVACQRKLDEALHWAAPADLYGDARSGHGAFCTTSYIELQRAKCWSTLGRPQRAVPIYKTALAGLPAAYNRDRGDGLAQLAGALVAVNEPEHAASVASEALAIASECGSGRTLLRIRAVGDQLRPHAKLPCVAQLFDDLAVAEQ